jgi:hypothetical protein
MTPTLTPQKRRVIRRMQIQQLVGVMAGDVLLIFSDAASGRPVVLGNAMVVVNIELIRYNPFFQTV